MAYRGSNRRIGIRGGYRVKQILKEFGKKGEDVVAQVTQQTALKTKSEAEFNVARTDNYTLNRGMVAYEGKNRLQWIVGNTISYAPYVEFGTGVFVQVAKEWEGFAMDFYVNGKGYSRPKPYLYPAFQSAKKVYKANLDNALRLLAEKYNK